QSSWTIPSASSDRKWRLNWALELSVVRESKYHAVSPDRSEASHLSGALHSPPLLPILRDQLPNSLDLVGRERTLFDAKRKRRQGEFSIERQHGWRCGTERLEMPPNGAHIAAHIRSSHSGRDAGTFQVVDHTTHHRHDGLEPISARRPEVLPELGCRGR